MLTDFQNSFTDRLSSKFLVTRLLNIQPHLKCVATLPCEIAVFKNRNDQELCEENCHARLSHSKHLPKNIYPVILASFPFTDEKIFTVAIPKNLQNDWQNASAATKKDDVIKRLHTRLTFTVLRQSAFFPVTSHQSAIHNWLTVHKFDTSRSRSECEWVSSFLMAHQHIIGHSVP